MGFGEHLVELSSEGGGLIVVAAVTAGKGDRRSAELLGESEGGAAGQLTCGRVAHADDNPR